MDSQLFNSVFHDKQEGKKDWPKISPRCRGRSYTNYSLKTKKMPLNPLHPQASQQLQSTHKHIYIICINYSSSKVGATCLHNVSSPFQTDLHSVQWKIAIRKIVYLGTQFSLVFHLIWSFSVPRDYCCQQYRYAAYREHNDNLKNQIKSCSNRWGILVSLL